MQIIGLKQSINNMRNRKKAAKPSCYRGGKIISGEWAVNASLKAPVDTGDTKKMLRNSRKSLGNNVGWVNVVKDSLSYKRKENRDGEPIKYLDAIENERGSNKYFMRQANNIAEQRAKQVANEIVNAIKLGRSTGGIDD